MKMLKILLYRIAKANRFSLLISIIASINRLVVYLRWFLYKKGILPSYSIRHKVICVGNLTVGGTGKTVMVEYLVRKLLTECNNLAILTRGYGRQGKGTVITPPTPAWQNLGDEAYMLGMNLKNVPIAIDSNRISGALQLVKKYRKRFIFVLDDGFQFLKLSKDLNILLLDAEAPFGGAEFFPIGKLRDGLWRLNDADILVLTKAKPGKDYKKLRKILRVWEPGKPVFIAEHKPVSFISLDDKSEFDLKKIRAIRTFGLAGIADPGSFLRTLNQTGIHPVGKKFFLDHHRYTHDDLRRLEAEAKQVSAQALITTQKDAVRLAGFETSLPIYYLKIEMYLREEGKFLDKLRFHL